MKVGMSITVMLLIVVALSAATVAETQPRHVLGFGIPAFGTLHYDETNSLASVSGFNLALGFSTRQFKNESGLQPNRFNSYSGWGTLLFIIPYVEIGAYYLIPIAGGDQYLVLDFGLLYYFLPRMGISVYY